MSYKTLRIFSGVLCALFCVLTILASVHVVKTMHKEEMQVFDKVAAVYETKYEEALRNYRKYADSVQLPQTSAGDDDSSSGDNVSQDGSSSGDDNGASDVLPGDLPNEQEPSTGDSNPEDKPNTDMPVATPSPDDNSSQGEDDKQSGDKNDPQNKEDNTEPDKGGEGSDVDSVIGDEPNKGGTPSDSTDETKDKPESEKLPSLADICVLDNNGHWVYIVKKGDTMYRISGLVGYSVQHLAEYNHMSNPGIIYEGEAIRIPYED